MLETKEKKSSSATFQDTKNNRSQPSSSARFGSVEPSSPQIQYNITKYSVTTVVSWEMELKYCGPGGLKTINTAGIAHRHVVACFGVRVLNVLLPAPINRVCRGRGERNVTCVVSVVFSSRLPSTVTMCGVHINDSPS